MRQRLLIFMLAFSFTLTVVAERKEVHILSANDMHAAITAFPQLADIADSLRALYPGLLVLSAGDNRTGDPLNDMYEIPAYPMVALMNQVGFDATALGNHEFDSRANGLAKLIDLSNFSYLCANISAEASLGIHTIPYKVFDVNGVKVGVIGIVQLGTHGIPDTHPANLTGISFIPPVEAAAQYEWLSQQCDVTILLSHNGYEEDVASTSILTWLDLIIGGHSHYQIDGGEMHNSIFVTQNVNRLKNVTHITLVVDDGKVVDKLAETISVRNHTGKNKVVAELVNFFSNNPSFERVLTQVATPFNTYEELGYMMCDAFVAEADAEVAIENAGGVRYDKHDVGPFTVNDVLMLDPFGNDAVELQLSAEELRAMLMSCYNNDSKMFPYVSGVQCMVFFDKNDTTVLKDLQLLTPDGKKLNKKKLYKVVTSSYVASICDSPRKDQGQSINRTTADLIISFLEKQPSISYQGQKRITFVTK